MAVSKKRREELKKIIESTVTAAAAKAAEDIARANAVVYTRVQWWAHLDNKTCPICGSRSGQSWKLTDRFPMPPAHLRCRCVLLPVRKYAKLPIKMDFEDWLKKQPQKTIDKVLGKEKGQLFVEGRLKLDQFVDETGEEYTLKELREIEEDAFEGFTVVDR